MDVLSIPIHNFVIFLNSLFYVGKFVLQVLASFPFLQEGGVLKFNTVCKSYSVQAFVDRWIKLRKVRYFKINATR